MIKNNVSVQNNESRVNVGNCKIMFKEVSGPFFIFLVSFCLIIQSF